MSNHDRRGALAPFERKLVMAFGGDGPCPPAKLIRSQMNPDTGDSIAHAEDGAEALFEACRQVAPCVQYCPLRRR